MNHRALVIAPVIVAIASTAIGFAIPPEAFAQHGGFGGPGGYGNPGYGNPGLGNPGGYGNPGLGNPGLGNPGLGNPWEDTVIQD